MCLLARSFGRLTRILHYGRKQVGAEVGYDPKKPVRPSHHPLVAFTKQVSDRPFPGDAEADRTGIILKGLSRDHDGIRGEGTDRSPRQRFKSHGTASGKGVLSPTEVSASDLTGDAIRHHFDTFVRVDLDHGETREGTSVRRLERFDLLRCELRLPGGDPGGISS